MPAVADSTSELIARHRALVEADPDTCEAFEQFILAGYFEEDARLHALVTVGGDVFPSVVVLSAALMARRPLEEVLTINDPRAHAVNWTPYHLRKLVSVLGRKRLDLSDDEIGLLFDLAFNAGWDGDQLAKIATTACEKLDDRSRLTALAPKLESALLRVNNPHGGPTARALRPRLRALVAAHSPKVDLLELDLSPIFVGDGWSRFVIEHLPETVTDPTLASEALDHLADATTGTSPSKKWRKAWSGLCQRGDDPDVVVATLVDGLFEAEPDEAEVEYWGGLHTLVLSPNNSDTMRGAVWALAEHDDDETVALLSAIAIRSHGLAMRSVGPNDKVANASVTMLGTIGSPAAIQALRQLRNTIKHQGLRKQITKALMTAAAEAGIRMTRLAEGSIPDFGLDAGGSKTVQIGTAVARVSITARHKPAIEWFPDATTQDDLESRPGKPKRTPPAEIAARHAPEITDLKAEVKELSKALAAERSRLESMLGEDDSWAFEQWASAYWTQPVTGHLARRLAWRVSTGEDEFVGFSLADSTMFVDQSGTRRRIRPEETTIRPWHPVHATIANIEGLRRVVIDEAIHQPFKQTYREVYVLTPAEEATEVYSNRFAGHILRYQQTYALMKERAWTTNYLGTWDGGGAGCARRTFDDARITAQFFHDPVDTGHMHRVDLCSTDQVRFIRVGDRTSTPLPLREIDPVVFSEAMRDVDLFVGVCSIGNDPTWQDRGEERFADYWNDYAFGELGSSAEVRREALQKIVPKLKIADRCEIDDRNLVVQGDRGTYRIHLGSGNVMMDPSRYLCIVTARGGPKAGSVFLPFDDDALLSIILSKAFLLAADTKITDATILRQMGTS